MYKAVLRETGETVAVKVQRPFVLETVSLDLFLMREAAEFVASLKLGRTDFVALLVSLSLSLSLSLRARARSRSRSRSRSLISSGRTRGQNATPRAFSCPPPLSLSLSLFRSLSFALWLLPGCAWERSLMEAAGSAGRICAALLRGAGLCERVPERAQVRAHHAEYLPGCACCVWCGV